MLNVLHVLLFDNFTGESTVVRKEVNLWRSMPV